MKVDDLKPRRDAKMATTADFIIVAGTAVAIALLYVTALILWVL